jgi:serine/threonine protein kinase
MEYMHAGSVRQVMLKNGTVTECLTIEFIGQILEGLAYIHDKGIVHNDLKCELKNVQKS